MRIIHVIGSYGFGGIGTLVFDLITAQKQTQGIVSELLVVKEKGELKDKFIKSGVTIHEGKFRSGRELSQLMKNL